MENAWRSRKSCSKLVLQPRYLNKLRGDLPSPKISRLLGGWRNKMQKMRKGVGFVWNTVLTTGCCLQLDDNCPGCLILLSGKIWDVDRYMTGVATVDKHIWKNTFPVSSVQIHDLFFHQHSVYWNDFQYIRPLTALETPGEHSWQQLFTYVHSDFTLPQKKIGLKSIQAEDSATNEGNQKRPTAASSQNLETQLPKKKEQLLTKVELGSPCTREILSVSVQSASVLACSEPRSTETAAADNSKGSWLRYLLFRSRLQQNQITESFRNPNRIKGLPGMPSCRIQAWSTIIQVYLDLLPQVTIVVTTWDY